MRKFAVHIFATAAALGALQSCSESNQVVISPEPITPLYESIYRFASLDSARQDSVMHIDSVALAAMQQYLGKDPVSRHELLGWSRTMPVKVFTPAVDSVFPSLDPVEKSLGIILHRAKVDSLNLPNRKYAAVVWGNRRSIVMVDDRHDSTMLIALNHYLGADYPGYAHWPLYMRLDKTPERLPYDIAEALVADRYPFRAAPENSVLARIVYEGVLTLAKIRLVPDGNMADALGYTQKQLEWISDNEHEIWMRMVEQKLLYSTSDLTAEQLVAPAPASTPISDDTPGRVGRYIGYRIICDFMRQNSRVNLAQMLSPDFYNNPAVLVEAAYDGQ